MSSALREMNKIERMKLLSFLEDEKEKEEEVHTTAETRLSKKLHEAAMKGTVASLLELLHESPQILTTTTPSSFDSPLHITALLGHLDFSRELLSRKPDLAGALNSHGSSPLHVASAKGYVEIVKELVLVNPDGCFVLDRDGRTPLHLAAIKGRVPVLTELARVKPEATRVLTAGGETCLHLCVKYNRLEALKVLVECVKKYDHDQFVNWKDRDHGNTILHLAVAKKQIEIVKFLLSDTGIEVSTRNANGFTALDVLLQSPRDLRDMEIKQCLQHGRTTRMECKPSITLNGCDITKVSSITRPQDAENSNAKLPKKHKHKDWLGKKRSALMIVASLLATVAFQAAISPPGGIWQDDFSGTATEPPHDVGQSVMAYAIPKVYGQFMIFNTITFLSSLSIILLLISGLPLRRRRWMWVQMVTVWIAITAQTATYFITFVQMTPKHVEGTLFQVTRISVLGWMSMMALVFIGNVVRVVLYLLRKYGYVKEKEREPSVYGEDDENDDL